MHTEAGQRSAPRTWAVACRHTAASQFDQNFAVAAAAAAVVAAALSQTSAVHLVPRRGL